MNMLEDEEEVWCFLLEEAERQGEFGMNQFILQKQEEATNAYHRVPQSEAPQWLQTVMLAEIAQQLERQNEHLERIAGHLEKVYISSDENFDLQDIAKKLSRIGSIIENATDK